MSALNQDQILLDDNITKIFERKIEIGAVIQFNLLQRIIEEFIKRQKELNDKLNNLELKINTLDRPLSRQMSEENIIKNLDESKTNLNFEPDKEISLKEKQNEKEKEDLKENENSKRSNLNEEKKEITENKEQTDTKTNIVENKNNNKKDILNNQYRLLSFRFDKVEKTLKDLTKKVYESNENNQNNNDNNDNNNNNNKDNKLLKNQNEKINKLEEEINQINQKIKEINVIQVDLPNDTEETKDKSAEIFKIFTKKLDLVENKTKKCEEDIFKLKKDLTDSNNLISSDKNNFNEFIKDTNKNMNDIKILINKEVTVMKNLIKENDEKLKNMKDNFDNENQNNKMIIEELKKNNENNAGNNLNAIKSRFNEKIDNLNNEFKNLLNKSSSETEKYLKSMINSLLGNIKNEISSLKENMKDKLVKTDIDHLELKLKDIENRLATETLRNETLEKEVNSCNDTCTKTVKMIEYLNGIVLKNKNPELGQEKKDDMLKGFLTINEKDMMQSFVDKIEFNREIKNIYKKIEQILEVESENYKFTQHIEGRLKFFVTQNELKTMEQCLKNMLDELKNIFVRKYMEKTEILKNLKYLEIQMKALYDSNPGVIKEGDNWLLAKKPMNNYLCASCESYLGELKNKNIYLPWNKIPPHDSRKYRMGNGFSRMLELVNTDLMKNAEKIDNNLIIKIDDKKSNYENNTPLPRLGSQINLKKWNQPNNTFYATNNDNVEKRLNNSADGLDINNSDSANKKNNRNSHEHNNIGKSLSNVGLGKNKNSLDTNTGPQLLKIVKKTKKDI